MSRDHSGPEILQKDVAERLALDDRGLRVDGFDQGCDLGCRRLGRIVVRGRSTNAGCDKGRTQERGGRLRGFVISYG